MRVHIVYFKNGTVRTAGAEMDDLPEVGDILEGFGFREPQVVTAVKTLSSLGSGIKLAVPENPLLTLGGETCREAQAASIEPRMTPSERLFGRAVGELLRPIRAVADDPKRSAFVRRFARGMSILVTSNELPFRCWLWGYTKRGPS